MAGIFTHYTYMVIVVLILTAEVKAQFFTVPIGRKPKPVQVEQQSPAIDSRSNPDSEGNPDNPQDNATENVPYPDCKGNTASHSGKAPSSRVSFSGERDAVAESRHPNDRARFSLPLQRIRITSPYGMRRHPIYKDWRFHNGIDLAAHYEPVYAMLDGTVTEVGSNPSAGKFVTIRHSIATPNDPDATAIPNDRKTTTTERNGPYLKITYMHLSRIHVTKGDCVLSGDIVALSGNTGVSCSPHLHIKATYRHRSLNPIHILRLFQQMQ